MLNQLRVSNTRSNFILISSSHFSVLLLLLCIYFLQIIPDLRLGIHKKLLLICHRPHKEVILSTAPGFRKDKKVVDHCFIKVPETVGFIDCSITVLVQIAQIKIYFIQYSAPYTSALLFWQKKFRFLLSPSCRRKQVRLSSFDRGELENNCK